MEKFSIARDEKQLLPYIKAAMAVQRRAEVLGLPMESSRVDEDQWQLQQGLAEMGTRILRGYAEYFVRWIEAYRKAGVNIYAITPQNEPNILSAYPSCLWTGEQLREFIAEYLGPTLRDRKANVELWLGMNGDPINHGEDINYRLVTVFDDPKASAFLTGAAYQYDSQNQIAVASQLYPEKKFMQSETECRNGKNSWDDAMHLYALMNRYIDGGASSYFAWNMVLDETGMSTWKWRQNALITVNGATGAVTWNGEYDVMRHFSQFVKPGAKRVLATGLWGDKIAFVNPDGSTVLVVANSDQKPHDVVMTVAGRPEGTFSATLPARSVNTFVVPAANGAQALSR